jgi:glutamate-1-semialdehyde 2,1-aminomutase
VTRAVAHSSTFHGSSIGIAAGLAVLSRLRFAGQGIYQLLTNRSRRLMAELEKLGVEAGVPVAARGPGPLFWLDLSNRPAPIPSFDIPVAEHARYEQFRFGLLERGVRVLPGGAWYVSAAHSDADIDLTLTAAREVLGNIGAGA